MSNIQGLQFGLRRAGEFIYVFIKPSGTLTHQDYELMTPMLDAAIAEVRQPKVNVLIDATEFSGWEVRAMWDDFKLGIHYHSEFHKIALYGNRTWQKNLAKVGNWFIGGEIRFFENETAAIDWLKES